MQANEDRATNFPTKKPSGSVRQWSIEDVRQALRRRLLAAEQETDPQKQSEILQKAWPLIRNLRRHGWAGPQWAVGFAAAMSAVLLVMAYRQNERRYNYQAPEYKFQILQKFDDSNFLFRRIHFEGARKTAATVHVVTCPGYTVNWSAGETLTRLTYLDFGSCWYFQSKGLGWDYEIGPNGHDTLAPNCREALPVVICEPNPMEANFREEE